MFVMFDFHVSPSDLEQCLRYVRAARLAVTCAAGSSPAETDLEYHYLAASSLMASLSASLSHLASVAASDSAALASAASEAAARRKTLKNS